MLVITSVLFSVLIFKLSPNDTLAVLVKLPWFSASRLELSTVYHSEAAVCLYCS